MVFDNKIPAGVFIPNREEGTANTENISEAFHLRFEVLKA
jgi:hypothetical protein